MSFHMFSASVTEASFFKYHTKIHDTVKGKLAATKLPGLFPKLQHEFAKGLDELSTPGTGSNVFNALIL